MPSLRHLILWLLAWSLLGPATGRAERYTYTFTRVDHLPDRTWERSTVVNTRWDFPFDEAEPIRGILLWGNGAGSDERARAHDLELVALADQLGFAVAATSHWGNFADPIELNAFESLLTQLAASSSHPELAHAPILPLGMSNGGQMSYALNALLPNRIIAFAANKGGVYNTDSPPTTALTTPGLLVSGGADEAYRHDAITGLFNTNRPRGARWAWAEEEGVTHEIADSMELILPFAEEMARTRYPDSLRPTATSAPTLRPLAEADGWLVTRDSHLTGLADIRLYAEFSGNRNQAGWLPSRRIAYIYRAFASHDKASPTAVLAPAWPTVERGTRLTYTIAPTDASWTRIDYYDGDTLLRSVAPGDANPFELTTTPENAGYTVLHALVTFADSRQRTTMPRRKLVTRTHVGEPPIDPELIGERDLDIGSPLHLVASMVGLNATPAFSIRWLHNGETLPGHNGSRLDLPAVAPNDAGIYQAVAETTSTRYASEPLHVYVSAPVTPVLGAITGPTSATRGDAVALTADIPDGQSGLTLQWTRNGIPISGATTPTLTIPLAQPWHAGDYVLTGRIRQSTQTSPLISLTVDSPTVSPGRLLNLSVRGLSRGGEQVMIAGFVTTGGTKSILTRAVGPGLAELGVTGTMPDPTLLLQRTPAGLPPESIAFNDNWGGRPDADSIRDTAARVGAFALPEAAADATALEILPAGSYAVAGRDAGHGAGIVLMEIYDADPTPDGGRLINVSNRGYVNGNDAVLVGGFVVDPAGPVDLLIRAIGPGLAVHGVSDTVANPQFTLFRQNPGSDLPPQRLLTVHNGGENGDAAEIAAAAQTVGAFAVPTGGTDAATVVRLNPGVYSAVVSAPTSDSGIALLEIYQLP